MIIFLEFDGLSALGSVAIATRETTEGLDLFLLKECDDSEWRRSRGREGRKKA